MKVVHADIRKPVAFDEDDEPIYIGDKVYDGFDERTIVFDGSIIKAVDKDGYWVRVILGSRGYYMGGFRYKWRKVA